MSKMPACILRASKAHIGRSLGGDSINMYIYIYKIYVYTLYKKIKKDASYVYWRDLKSRLCIHNGMRYASNIEMTNSQAPNFQPRHEDQRRNHKNPPSLPSKLQSKIIQNNQPNILHGLIAIFHVFKIIVFVCLCD